VKVPGISQEKNGVSGADLNRWIRQKRNFAVDRIVQPNFRKVESLIRKGSGFILRYVWEVDERGGAHFVFVCPASGKRVVVANPHRESEAGKYEKFRYFSESELKACFRKQKVGNRYYPWIWPITRGGGR
jgi:rRNA maturation protein Nop10